MFAQCNYNNISIKIFLLRIYYKLRICNSFNNILLIINKFFLKDIQNNKFSKIYVQFLFLNIFDLFLLFL